MTDPNNQPTACPFDCGWTTDDPMRDVEADAVAGGWDRLVWHLRVEHGATPERL
jgi:hypothetical protein